MADWGQALMAGLGAGATAYGNQAMAQQQAERDDERWLQRQQQLQASQAEAQKARERYLLAISPPQTDQQTVQGPDGRRMVQNREWVPPTEEQIAAGERGQFRVTGESEVPRKLAARSYQAGNENVSELYDSETGETVREQGRGPKFAPREPRAAGGGSGEGGQGRLVRKVGPDGRAVYGMVKDGTFVPVKDESGNDLTSVAWRPRKGDKPLGQFSGAKGGAETTAPPAQSAGSSPANPIDYQPGMPKPPSGTYVRKPDGTVVRVP